MSSRRIDRRRFLTVGGAAAGSLLGLGGRAVRVVAAAESRGGTYAVDVGILFGMLAFRMAGRIEEAVDRAAGKYRISLIGEGRGIDNHAETTGELRGERWVPVRSLLVVHVAGREARTDVTYDHVRGVIDYRYRGETFFLRRIRSVADTVAMPPSTRVDDMMSATLNYADGLWPPERDGTYRTLVVRRRRRDDEGTDDVDGDPHAELVPFVLRVESAGGTGRRSALVDLSRFSAWARREEPARITFGPDRRPEEISSSLILGTSVTIRIQSPTIRRSA